MKFNLRSYTARDFEDIHEIDRQCFEPDIAYSRADMRMYLRLSGAECVISETDDGKMAGFCLAAHEEGIGYLITMDVVPRYRRHGVATALLDNMEKRLAAQLVGEMWLETATANQPAIAFWQKHGYRRQGIRKGYYPGGGDAYTMRKVLARRKGADSI